MVSFFSRLFFAVSWLQVRIEANEPNEICDIPRVSTDVIMVLGQKKHSSYDSTHLTSLAPIFLSLEKYYPHAKDSDVILWHEGDITRIDLPPVSFSIRLCDLRKSGAWGLPPGIEEGKDDIPKILRGFSLGYR